MADEQCKWLDRSTAERLLRGEPLQTVDADKRDQADRLVRALGALTAEPPLSSAELPGEANAMAAFRKAQAARDGEHASLGQPGHSQTATWADAELVRIGRASAGRRGPSRVARPVRYGLAATLAAGMLGGAAMIATAGVLPFTDDDVEPGSTVTAPATPKRPLITPSPGQTRGGAPEVPNRDGGTGGATGDGSPSAPDTRDDARREAPGSTPSRPRAGGNGKEARSAEWLKKVTAACRDVRDGKKLSPARRRSLEEAASGPERVRQYCTNLLARSQDRDNAAPEENGRGDGDSDDAGDSDDGADGGGKNGKRGKHGKDGKGKREEPGEVTPAGATPTSDAQRAAPASATPASATPASAAPRAAPAPTTSA